MTQITKLATIMALFTTHAPQEAAGGLTQQATNSPHQIFTSGKSYQGSPVFARTQLNDALIASCTADFI